KLVVKVVMKRIAFIFVLGTMFPLVAQGFGIYKCVGGAYTAYQNFPCAAGLEAMPLGPETTAPVPRPSVATQPQQLASAATTAQTVSTQPSSAQPEAVLSSMLPFRVGPLKVGMSDDQVLNLPRWGVPDKIVRSK